VNFQKLFNKTAGLFSVSLLLIAAAAAANGQGTPTLVIENTNGSAPAAGNTNLYCAGFVQTGPVSTENRIIGAENEQEKFNYSQNDYMYINMGANKGVREGDMFSVIRPRGRVESRWTKKDELGFYVQEVGALEIVSVKPEVSVARIKTSCSSFLLGDLVQPVAQRTSPVIAMRPVIDRFAVPSGKASGRIVLARDNQEMITRDQIVYVDLGADDRVQVGDNLTVYRRLGKGHLFISDEDEAVSARDEGFHSSEYRGGKFSNQAARKSGSKARGHVVTTEKAKEGRPSGLRKIVGEAVVVNVKERTATVVITRTAQEIHTGDWVEIQ
jgi:Flagellar assembly protein T, C-terminal domain